MLRGVASLFYGHVKLNIERPGRDLSSKSSLFRYEFDRQPILMVLSADITPFSMPEEHHEFVAQKLWDSYAMMPATLKKYTNYLGNYR